MSQSNEKQLIEYKPKKDWLCCIRFKDRSHFQNILQSLDLTYVQKQTIQARYLDIVENFQHRAH